MWNGWNTKKRGLSRHEVIHRWDWKAQNGQWVRTIGNDTQTGDWNCTAVRTQIGCPKCDSEGQNVSLSLVICIYCCQLYGEIRKGCHKTFIEIHWKWENGKQIQNTLTSTYIGNTIKKRNHPCIVSGERSAALQSCKRTDPRFQKHRTDSDTSETFLQTFAKAPWIESVLVRIAYEIKDNIGLNFWQVHILRVRAIERPSHQMKRSKLRTKTIRERRVQTRLLQCRQELEK